jgi:hypothetical protein
MGEEDMSIDDIDSPPAAPGLTIIDEAGEEDEEEGEVVSSPPSVPRVELIE